MRDEDRQKVFSAGGHGARSEIAKKAVAARWAGKADKA